MTTRGAVLNMASLGKKFEKMDMSPWPKIAAAPISPPSCRIICDAWKAALRRRCRSPEMKVSLISKHNVLQYRICDPDGPGDGGRQDVKDDH